MAQPKGAALRGSARSLSASKSMGKKFASWGRKAYCCARSSPLQAQKRRVLACPVLYRSGAPERIRTSGLCLRRATLYPAELRALRTKQYPIDGPGATGWHTRNRATGIHPRSDRALRFNTSRAITVGLCQRRAGLPTIEPCRMSKHHGRGHHAGNFTRSRILPLIDVAVSAPS
jgi:hypothetical protein